MRDSLPPEPRESLPSLSELYEVLFELGHGGMGTVFLARMAGVGGFERLVVVKRMNPELTARADLVRRFLNEAKIASHVHHANVVGVQIIGEDQDGYFLVLDYVEGDSFDSILMETILRGERVPLPVLLRIMLDGLAGLHAIHEARDPRDQPLNILHRDVSTCNLLVGTDGVTRVTDFGVAKSGADAGQTGGLLVGKALYMAPEYLRQLPVDRKIDVYAMGLVLWIALARRQPWPDAAPAQLMVHAVSEGVPPLPEGTVPRLIADVVAKACALDPNARYASAREMATALLRAATKSGVEVAEPFDVAALVNHLAGPKLSQRRRAAGSLGSRAIPISAGNGVETVVEASPPAPVPTPMVATLAIPLVTRQPTLEEPPDSSSEVVPLRGVVSRSIPAPELPARTPWKLIGALGAGALVAILAVAFLVMRSGQPEPARAATPTPASSASDKPLDVVTPPAATSAASVAAPPPAAADSAKSKTGGGRPATTRGGGTTGTSPGGAPTAIVTGNPYR